MWPPKPLRTWLQAHAHTHTYTAHFPRWISIYNDDLTRECHGEGDKENQRLRYDIEMVVFCSYIWYNKYTSIIERETIVCLSDFVFVCGFCMATSKNRTRETYIRLRLTDRYIVCVWNSIWSKPNQIKPMPLTYFVYVAFG